MHNITLARRSRRENLTEGRGGYVRRRAGEANEVGGVELSQIEEYKEGMIVDGDDR